MNPINLEQPITPNPKWHQINEWPLFMLAFRPFFLAAGIHGFISIAVWGLVLSGLLTWPHAIATTYWHAHEMIFAFAGAVAVGFLFTASKNWTNINGLSSKSLALLCSIWLLGRFSFFLPQYSIYVALVCQLIFWLFTIIALANVLLTVNSIRNYLFLPMLSILCILNVAFLYSVHNQAFHIASGLSNSAVLLFSVLISVIGGRVIPFFTQRGLQLTHKVLTPTLDKLCIAITLLCTFWFIASQAFLMPISPAIILIITGTLHLIRFAKWFNPKVLTISLLWSLYGAYFFMAIGLIACGVSYFSSIILFKDALHIITIGGIGLIIIAMMARVSLGHTARPLQVPWFIGVAFFILFIATIIRGLLPQLIGAHIAWQTSALLWCISLLIFTCYYAPILLNKRLDGQRG